MTATPSPVYWSTILHKDWTVHLAATERGLCCATLPGEGLDTLEHWVKRHIPEGKLILDEERLAAYRRQFEEYFAGSRREFTFPLDLRGTPFQVEVWQALLQIPYGTVKSYSDIATTVNRPAAVRAVGAANGANPIPIAVPCHRVIGKNGTLTGYRGGLTVKVELLRLEGFRPVAQPETATSKLTGRMPAMIGDIRARRHDEGTGTIADQSGGDCN